MAWGNEEQEQITTTKVSNTLSFHRGDTSLERKKSKALNALLPHRAACEDWDGVEPWHSQCCSGASPTKLYQCDVLLEIVTFLTCCSVIMQDVTCLTGDWSMSNDSCAALLNIQPTHNACVHL